MNDTESEDERLRSQYETKGKLRMVGQGPVQPKPGKDELGLGAVVSPGDLVEARDQAIEALRQQKVGPAQRELVTDFYKHLSPGGERERPRDK